MATVKHRKEVVLQKPEFQVFDLKVVGITNLLCHRRGPEVMQAIEAKRQGKTVKQKVKDPEALFHQSYYLLEKANGSKPIYGFPLGAFKTAAVAAAYTHANWITKAKTRGGFQILPHPKYGALTPLQYGHMRMRVDVGVNPTTHRPCEIYRAEFEGWSCVLTVRVYEQTITADQLVNLLNVAGFAVGIGNWRPERRGSFGQFEVTGA